MTQNAQRPEPAGPEHAEQAPAPETVTVIYTGETPFIYGDRTITAGDELELPTAEVQAWADSPPQAFKEAAAPAPGAPAARTGTEQAPAPREQEGNS